MPLHADTKTDIAVVGGGIAGVTTAFFILRNTNKKVVLLEADRIAHGATGHNAGQVTSYFERPFEKIVEEFGLERATEGQRAVESAWKLLDEIITSASLTTPLYRFTGYTGYSTLAQVLECLKENRFRTQGGLLPEKVVVSRTWPENQNIPPAYDDLYTLVEHEDLLGLLETRSHSFIAASSSQKGCMNSALFSEELCGYLAATYPSRFSFYEGSPVQKVRLFADRAVLEVHTHRVTADRAVLCTNGFENFTITNEAGPDIDTAFHHSVVGRIGYMSGYLEPMRHPPIAISYRVKEPEPDKDPVGEDYFYITRRPYEHEQKGAHNLVCAGGPDTVLPNGADYSREDACSENIREVVDNFLRDSYDKYPTEDIQYTFCWHGLMGYTPNLIRRIGPEPINPVLLYNLGCNGVGILPSIYGGYKIAQFVNGETLLPSIFDPHDQR